VPISPGTRQLIENAAQKFGVSANVLASIAQRESGGNVNAKNPDSSATGLFQIVKGTWDGLVSRYGKMAGVSPDASPYNPTANALMAAALARENTEVLKSLVGREPTGGEIYAAHFMGGAGAVHLIRMTQKQPDAPAAAVFPSEAAANPTIFYTKDGMPKSVADVYKSLTTMKAETSAPDETAAKDETKSTQQQQQQQQADTTYDVTLPTVKPITPAVSDIKPGPQLESDTAQIANRLGVKPRGLMG